MMSERQVHDNNEDDDSWSSSSGVRITTTAAGNKTLFTLIRAKVQAGLSPIGCERGIEFGRWLNICSDCVQSSD